MNSNPTTCDPERIELFLGQQLSDEEQATFELHLDDCDDCRCRLEATAAGDDIWSAIRDSLQSSESEIGPTAGGETTLSYNSVLNLLAPTDDERMLGRLGTYEVVGIIGSGGMGIVLKALDTALNRYVAIKILAPHLGSSGSARKRFSREAQAAAAVVHDNVIEIHGVADAGELPYLVMPYVRGPSLQKRLDDEGPLALAEILRIGMQAASGLAAAHSQGLVHRDVKPANILLADGVERVKLTDFGLARAADDVSLTRTGVIAGTPEFMSPEQSRGESVGQKSDLFSLGSVLYAMCTGRAPFRAETSYGVLRRITDEEPRPIREINPAIPEWLCQIIARLMSKQPDDRLESAGEVAELLEECLAHVQQPTAVPLPALLATQTSSGRSFSGSRRKIGVLTMIAAFGFAFCGLFLWPATDPPDIAGKWSGEGWGEVVLEQKQPGKYEGAYTDVLDKKTCTRPNQNLEQPPRQDCMACHSGESLRSPLGKIEMKWSRLERRFNGKWSAGKDRFGKISIRLVDDEIRGAWTTSKKSKIDPGTPRLADLVWERARNQPNKTSGTTPIQERRELNKPTIDVDFHSPVSVAEAYVAYAFSGQAELANELTQGRAKKRRIAEMLPQDIDAPTLAITAWAMGRHSNFILASSELAQLKEGPPDESDEKKRERKRFAKGVRLLLYLERNEKGLWGITDVDLDSEDGFQKRRNHILHSAADGKEGDEAEADVQEDSLTSSDPLTKSIETVLSILRGEDNEQARLARASFDEESNRAIRRFQSHGGHEQLTMDQLLVDRRGVAFGFTTPLKSDDGRLWIIEMLLERQANDSWKVISIDEDPAENGPRDLSRFRGKYPGARTAINPTEAMPKRLNYSTTGHDIKIAYSPDGKRIAVANGNPTRIMQTNSTSRVTDNWKPTADILDVETGKMIVSFKLITDDEEAILAATERVSHVEATDFAFSPDGNVIAIGTSIGQVKLFDAQTGELLQSLDDEKARLADKETPENWKPLRRAMGSIASLKFSPDGKLLAMCGGSFTDFSEKFNSRERLGRKATEPGRLKVWEVKSGTLKHDLFGHSYCRKIAFSPDGYSLASAGGWATSKNSGTGVILWNSHTGAKIRHFNADANGGIKSIAFSPDSKMLAISTQRFGEDGSKHSGGVRLLYVSTGILDWMQTVPGWANPVAFTPDGNSIAVLCGGQTIRFLDTKTGEVNHKIESTDSSHSGRWNDFAIAPDGHTLAVGGVDDNRNGSVELWDVDRPSQ